MPSPPPWLHRPGARKTQPRQHKETHTLAHVHTATETERTKPPMPLATRPTTEDEHKTTRCQRREREQMGSHDNKTTKHNYKNQKNQQKHNQISTSNDQCHNKIPERHRSRFAGRVTEKTGDGRRHRVSKQKPIRRLVAAKSPPTTTATARRITRWS